MIRLQVAENLNYCDCVWGGDTLLTGGLEADCHGRGWTAHRAPFCCALGLPSRSQDGCFGCRHHDHSHQMKKCRKEQNEPPCLLFPWRLNLLRRPLACRLVLASVSLARTVAWKFLATSKAEKVGVRLSSLHADGDRDGCWDASWVKHTTAWALLTQVVSGKDRGRTQALRSRVEWFYCSAILLFFEKCVQHYPTQPLLAEMSRQKSLHIMDI